MIKFADFKEKENLKIKSFKRSKGFKLFSSQNILLYSYLLAWGGLVYGFDRILSNRVNELQGKVDNLYQKINDSKKSNEVLNKK